MAKKEFAFMGKSIEELQQMDLKAFAALANARARRSLERGFDKKFLKKIEASRAQLGNEKPPKAIRTHKRDTVIIPAMIGLKFAVYNGHSFENVEIMPQMLGHYLGEMALTRKKLSHGKAGIGATKSSTAITARG